MVRPAESAAERAGKDVFSRNPLGRESAASVAVGAEAWTTALGSDLTEVWQRLLRGEAGFSQLVDSLRLRNHLAAVVRNTPPPGLNSRTVRSTSQHLHWLATQTISRTLRSITSFADLSEIDLVIGTSLGDFLETSCSGQTLNSWAQEVASSVGLKGQVISLSTACSSSADAILVGAEMIRSGASQICLCGGADVVSGVKRLGHSSLGTMSPTRLRPFDQQHDGTLLGEGAAFLLLLSPEMNEKLPSQSVSADEGQHEPVPTVWLRGVGSANDGASMSGPDPEGRGGRFAIERSLADAGLTASSIHVINAHGSGTQLNDETEIATYQKLFSDAAGTRLFATKGAFGHTLGATGAMEAIAVIQALRTGWVPPITGLKEPLIAAENLPLVVGEASRLPQDARYGLSLTLGFGGFDTSLIFEVKR